MIRSAASKVVWVGRATVFLVGLAVILALVVGFATTALAGTGVGATFNLGKLNTVNRISQLVGAPNNAMLRVDNRSTGTNATALDLRVNAGRPPCGWTHPPWWTIYTPNMSTAEAPPLLWPIAPTGWGKDKRGQAPC